MNKELYMVQMVKCVYGEKDKTVIMVSSSLSRACKSIKDYIFEEGIASLKDCEIIKDGEKFKDGFKLFLGVDDPNYSEENIFWIKSGWELVFMVEKIEIDTFLTVL